MGNEFSWPCTDRKEQMRRLRMSKFDMSLVQDYESTPESARSQQNLSKIDVILSKRGEFLSRQKHENVSISSTRSSGVKNDNHEPNSDNEENEENGLDPSYPVLVVESRNMNLFGKFIEELRNVYDSQMVPIIITPHPELDECIVVLQSREKFNQSRNQKMTKFKTVHFKKNFKPTGNTDLYQQITNFISSKHSENMTYIGCYTNDENEKAMSFNFVFTLREDVEPDPSSKLEFETLEKFNEDEVAKKLDDRARMNYMFCGSFVIPTNNSTITEGQSNRGLSSMHVMIFEKAKTNYNYKVSEITGDLSPEFLKTQLTQNMIAFCEIEKADFVGIVSSTESQSIILILSQ